jgi:hypothetical protein
MKINFDFLNDVKLVISGGTLVILLTLTGYIVYTQINDEAVSGGSTLQGEFFNMISKFNTENIRFENANQALREATEDMNSTKNFICPIDSSDPKGERCPLGAGERSDPFAP